MEPRDYLEPSGAARVVGVSVDYIRKLARSGRLRPALVTEGGRRIFLRKDVERFAAERRERKRA